MKIKIVSFYTKKDQISPSLVSAVTRQLAKEAEVDTEAVPDIVHVWGAWDAHVFRAVRHYANLKIPVVYSPLGGLTPWQMKRRRGGLLGLARYRSQKQAIRGADHIVTFSKAETENVSRWVATEKITELRNPIITNKYPLPTLAADMRKRYEVVISTHDAAIRKEIADRVAKVETEDDNVRTLLWSVLYAHYQQHQGAISHKVLQELTSQLLALNFDEDHFLRLLSKMNLLKFMALLQTRMAEDCGLTEGFMPVPLKE